VQLALQKREFLPEAIGVLSRRFQTPVRAILLCTLVPAAVVVLVQGDMALLGDLYAFGLLGAFVMTSVGIDVLRWKEGQRGALFWIGALTSAAVLLAFGVNLYAKPMATVFGGGLTLLGMGIAHGSHYGWLERLIEKIPGMVPPKLAISPDGFHTFDQVRAMPKSSVPGVLVASRGATRKLFQEAVDRAKGRGLNQLYLVYVDEVPGLLFPQLAQPTPEGITVLEAGCTIIRSLGMEPVPVWGLSHSAAQAVAEAAEACGCDTVVIGATQRTFLWQALRGRFIQEALRQLPAEIRLVVVG
jgi:nucleotide-binding universal stress UspA family protein